MVGVQASPAQILLNSSLSSYECAQHFDIWPKRSVWKLCKEDIVIHMSQMRKESQKVKCLAKSATTSKGRSLEKILCTLPKLVQLQYNWWQIVPSLSQDFRTRDKRGRGEKDSSPVWQKRVVFCPRASELKVPESLIFAESLVGDPSRGVRAYGSQGLPALGCKYKQELKSHPTLRKSCKGEHLRIVGSNLGNDALFTLLPWSVP